MDQPETRTAYGGHVCKRIKMNLAIFRGPSIDASYQFWFIWPSSFRGEDFFLEIDQPETRIANGGHVC